METTEIIGGLYGLYRDHIGFRILIVNCATADQVRTAQFHVSYSLNS